jgi:hypothetical protein
MGTGYRHPCAGSNSATPVTANCVYYLASNQQDSPRNCGGFDGRAVRFTILETRPTFRPDMFVLQRICIPSSIETISDLCFSDCRSLSWLAFESSSKLSTLGERAFQSSSLLQSICLPSSVETISQSCFSMCGHLSASVFGLGSDCFTLGESAFQCCCSLRSICIPSSVEAIPGFCFSGCVSLSTLTFEPPYQISSLGDLAFQICRSLRSVVLPSSIETIGFLCFAGCDNLVSIVLEFGSRLSAEAVRRLELECEMTFD